jgi:hypothetical protein
VPRQLTVNVQGSLGLDDGQRLIEELGRATGLTWRAEPVEDDGHLTGGIVEIVLVAVLGKSTELVYGAAVEKARERIEQWRREHLDKPEYILTEETTDESGAENAQPEEHEAGA